MSEPAASRRLNGQGTEPYQRPGRKGWWTRVRVTDAHTGQTKRIEVSAPTKTLLAAKVRDRVTDAGAGRLAGAEARMSVAAYSVIWSTQHLAAKDVTPSTKRLYRDSLKNHVLPVLGGRRLDRIRTGDIKEMDARIQTLGLSKSSRRRAYNVVRMMFDCAVQDRLLKSNPAEGVDRPADPPSAQPYYNLDQIRELVTAMEGHRVLEHLVPLMVWTGMRPGEALALHWEDVDLKAGLVMVAATVAVDEDGRVYRQGFPKAKKPRLVPLVAPAIAVLKSARKAQAEERLAVGKLWADPRLVFTDQIGRLIDDRDLRKRYAPLIKSLGLSGSLQALRRSTATALTAEDVPLGVVAQILGHSSTVITEAHYTIINVAMMQQGLARFQARMEEAE